MKCPGKAGIICLVLLCSVAAHAQWKKQTNGLYGGYINCLASNGSRIFAGTNSGGVFISDNDGLTWTSSNTGIVDFPQISAIAVGPSGIFLTLHSFIYRSTDNGNSWNKIYTLPNGHGLLQNSIVISGQYIYVGTDMPEVYSSPDGGNTWGPTNIGSTQSIDSMLASGPDIWVATDHGRLFKTTNGLGIWNEITTIPPTGVTAMCALGGSVFASIGGRLYRTDNNGGTWSPLNPGPQVFYNALTVQGGKLFATHNTDIITSGDGGNSWSTVNNGVPAYTTQITTMLSHNNKLYAGVFPGGIYFSANDGANWTLASTGITNTGEASFCVVGSKTFASTSHGIFVSNDDGLNWSMVSTVGGARLHLDGTTIIGAVGRNSSNGQNLIFASSDGGVTWPQVGQITVPNGSTTIFSKPTSTGSEIYVGLLPYGVFKSIDHGVNWTDVTNGLPNTNVWSTLVKGSKIFVATDRQANSGIYVSQNGGASWSSSLSSQFVSALTLRGDTLYAATYNDGIYLSTNDGASWTRGSVCCTSMSMVVTEHDYMLVGGIGGGIRLSRDQGSTWIDVSQGLSVNVNTLIPDMAIVGDDLLITEIFGSTVWSRPLAEMLPISQTITFGSLTATSYGAAPITLAATASSGLPVSYSSSDPAVATVSGNTSTIVGVGTTTITASQAGNSIYRVATPVSQTLTVNKGAQAISFDNLSAAAISTGSITLSATSSVGLPVTYTSSNPVVATVDGNVLKIVGYGTTTITASQSGNGTFNPATDVQQILDVERDPIEVYNVVTPNGDGAHDFLKILFVEEYTNVVYLYDRWGNEVFEVKGYDNNEPQKRFEGTANVAGSRALNDGTYFYVIDLGLSKKVTGFIELMR